MPTKPKYDLLDDSGIAIASEMDLEYAVLFLKTLMLEYYAEKEVMYSIRRHVYEVETTEIDSHVLD